MDEYITAAGFGEIGWLRWNTFMSIVLKVYGTIDSPRTLPDTYCLRRQILARIGRDDIYLQRLLKSESSFNTKTVGLIRSAPQNVQLECSGIVSEIFAVDPDIFIEYEMNEYLIEYVPDAVYEKWLEKYPDHMEITFPLSIMHKKLHCFKRFYINNKPENFAKLLDFMISDVVDKSAFGIDWTITFGELLDAFAYLKMN